MDRYFTGERIIRDVTQYQAAAFVLATPEDRIVSFYTLANFSIGREKLSKSQQKRYSYDPIAAIIISYFGVDKPYHRQGYGERTLALALERCYKVSEHSGVTVVVVDVETKNDAATAMYRKANFVELGTRQTDSGFELRTFYLPMKTIAAAIDPTPAAAPAS